MGQRPRAVEDLVTAPTCRGCGSLLRTTFVDLGETPLANSYLAPDEVGRERTFPLHVRVCDECLLVQVDDVVPPERIFSDYAYLSSYSSSWVEHARRFAESAIERFDLDSSSLVVELASNDGYLLQHFRAKGIPVLGVEPAANVAEVAVGAGIPTLVEFFGADVGRRLRDEGRSAQLVIANNVLAHVPDLNGFVAGIAHLLAPAGTASIEFPHLLNLIREVQFDTIYHEHFSYFAMVALEPVLTRHGLRLFDVERLATHGGSLRIHLCRTADDRPTEPAVDELRADESASGLDAIETYAGFQARVDQCCASLRAFLSGAAARGERVVAYGAAAKGNTLLNTCGVAPGEIDYVVDRSVQKQGKLTPGTHLRIEPPERLDETKPDWVLVLPWNIIGEIAEEIARVRNWGARVVTAIPEVRVHE